MEGLIIKKSNRARHLRLTVKTDGTVVLTQPSYIPHESAIAFVREKSDWIERAVAYYRHADLLQIPKPSKRDFEKYKREAKLLILEKLRIHGAYYKEKYGDAFSFKNVSVKNQKSRWGSCSRHGNLNFSYRIIFLPEHLQDYLIVHELCHLKSFGHGRDFWALVRERISIEHIREFRKRVR